MRSMRTLLLGILLVALAACGGGPASSSDESTGGEPSNAASQSEAAAESPAESEDNGGPSSVTDVDSMIDELTPPNSTQISRTDAGGSSIVAWESTDTVGDLKSYYVQKIAELNLSVLTTTEAANTYAVAVGTNAEGTGLGATVAISNQGDVTNVLVTAADGG